MEKAKIYRDSIASMLMTKSELDGDLLSVSKRIHSLLAD